MRFTTVSLKKFRKFIDEYPRPLVRDVSSIFEPPIVTYNDFTLGKWPDCVVGKYSVDNEQYAILDMDIKNDSSSEKETNRR